MDNNHNPGYIVALGMSCVTFMVAMVFNGLAGASPEGLALFLNSTGGVSSVYYTDITPAGWTFSIWGFIYGWQALFLSYSLSLLCRRTTYGYLSTSPGHQPAAIYWLYSVNMLSNIAWLLLWDRFLPQYSLLFALLLPFTLLAALGVSHAALYRATPVLRREAMAREVWATRIFTQNGLAFYATWTIIAAIINLDVVVIYIAGYDVSLAGTICLGLLLIGVVTYFFLDNFVLDRFLRYTITPYIVLIVGITGSLVNNWELTSNNSVLTALLLGTIALAGLLKMVVVGVRARSYPIHPPEDEVAMFLEDSGKKDYGTVRYEPIDEP